jgi:conjugal transfer pilus assembly protein TrbC
MAPSSRGQDLGSKSCHCEEPATKQSCCPFDVTNSKIASPSIPSGSQRQYFTDYSVKTKNDNSLSENFFNTIQSFANKNTSISPLQQKIIVFVSFSMPDASLRQWLVQAAQMHASLVIRGLIHNSFKETLKKIKELLGDQKGGVQLDPNLFRKFNIQQVPAVVVVNQKSNSEFFPLPNDEKNQHDGGVVYGDVSLEYALSIVARHENRRPAD